MCSCNWKCLDGCDWSGGCRDTPVTWHTPPTQNMHFELLRNVRHSVGLERILRNSRKNLQIRLLPTYSVSSPCKHQRQLDFEREWIGSKSRSGRIDYPESKLRASPYKDCHNQYRVHSQRPVDSPASGGMIELEGQHMCQRLGHTYYQSKDTNPRTVCRK